MPQTLSPEPTPKEGLSIASIVLASISFLTIVPSPIAFAFSVSGLIGAQSPKEKKRNTIALFLSIPPLLVFIGASVMTLRDIFIGSGYRITDAVTPAIVGSYILLSVGLLPLLFGVIARVRSKNSTRNKQWLTLAVIGMLFTVLGAGQYAWAQSSSPQTAWIEGKLASTEPSDATLVNQLRIYKNTSARNTYAPGEPALFGNTLVKDVVVKVAKDSFGDDLFKYTADGYKSVIVAFNIEPGQDATDETAADFDLLYQKNIRLIAGGTRFANTLSASSNNGLRVKTQLNRTHFVEFAIKQNQQPDKLEYKVALPALIGIDGSDSITCTLKL